MEASRSRLITAATWGKTGFQSISFYGSITKIWALRCPFIWVWSFNPSHFMEASRRAGRQYSPRWFKKVSIHLILWKHHEGTTKKRAPYWETRFNPSHFMEASRRIRCSYGCLRGLGVSIHLILWKHHEGFHMMLPCDYLRCFNPSHFMEASRRRQILEFNR